MRKRYWALFLMAGLTRTGVCDIAPVATSSVTLRQCFEWARQRSEDLKIRQEAVEQSNAQGRALLGTAYPRLSWKLDSTYQDPGGVNELQSQGFSGFVEKNQTESKFTLEQPLFSGLREFSAWSASLKQTQSNRFRLERAALELYEQIAYAFYGVVGQETNRQNTDSAYRLAQDRVKELRSFLRLGKARKSEVFTAQAHAAALKAKLDRAQTEIQSSREELSYLTGRDLGLQPLLDEIPSPMPVSGIDETLTLAKERTDLKALRQEAEAKKLRIRYERGSYWPNADLTGNYYTRRATFLDAIDWDVMLSLEVPLYQGGVVAAKVREATSAYRQAQLELEQAERHILYNVRRVHSDLTGAQQEVKSLEEASQAAKESYDSLQKEYRYGLVTNLDVLQALDLMQDQQSDLDAARVKAKRLYIQLLVSMEKML